MGILLFAVLAAVAIGSSVMMVIHRNPVYSALAMVVTFVDTAIMFLLLGAPFVAALQIIVYAGAIIVLFLFVIMFLNLKTGALIEKGRSVLLLALIIAGLIGGQLMAVVAGGGGAGSRGAGGGGLGGPSGFELPVGFGSVESVAELLFTRYLVPFEITSVLLVVAMVGAVVLARRSGSNGESTFELSGGSGVSSAQGAAVEPRPRSPESAAEAATVAAGEGAP